MKKKKTLTKWFFMSIVAISVCSCSKKDNPSPTSTGVRKPMSASVTVTGLNDNQPFILTLTAMINESDNASSASPVIDDRDQRTYANVSYSNDDFTLTPTLTAHSESPVSGFIVSVASPGTDVNITPALDIEIKIYSDGKLVDDRIFKNFTSLQKIYTVNADGK